MCPHAISEPYALRQMTTLPTDEKTIAFRQETIRALWDDEELLSSLETLIEPMKEVTVFAHGAQETDRPLLEVIWRLGELELYVSLLERTAAALTAAKSLSSALQAYREELLERKRHPSIEQLEKELPSLRKGIKLHQSVTIGVNLDDKLRPVEAALLGVHAKRFREGHFMSGFLGKATGDPYLTTTPLIRSGAGVAPPERMPLAPLFEELDSVLRPMVRPLARKLRAYMQVNTDIFRALYPELAYLVGAVRWLQGLRDTGYAVSFPSIEAGSARVSSFAGLYNLRLASHWGESGRERMVGNDLSLTDEARIFVLTGPNGGGKTTFTQAVGIAVVLAQQGFPIPATAGSISPVESIMTHFPVEEDFDDEIGRFEDEARRISALFDSLSDRSLVLLNEPLASTSPKEAEGIAAAILDGLSIAGARGIFTTHFHSLALDARDSDGESRLSHIGTLNAGVRVQDGHATRTYEISAGPPAGSSFAEDVARRYQIDRESLRTRLTGEPDATR